MGEIQVQPGNRLACPVCSQTLMVRLAKGRTSGKNFLMFLCPRDGRHLRGFITDQGYVKRVLETLDSRQMTKQGGSQ